MSDKLIRRRKLIKFLTIEMVITLIVLLPFLVPKIGGIVEYRLPLTGYLPARFLISDRPFLRSGCGNTPDFALDCDRPTKCYTQEYLIGIGQWPLMDITSSTDEMAVLSPPVMAAYRMQDGKKTIYYGGYKSLYVSYGERCYIPFYDLFAE